MLKIPKPTVRIDDWAVVATPNSGRFELLTPGSLLVGRVFGHPRIKEGSFIFSSPVVNVSTDQNVVETRNSEYVLGRVSTDYKAWNSEQHNEAA